MGERLLKGRETFLQKLCLAPSEENYVPIKNDQCLTKFSKESKSSKIYDFLCKL